jgi:spore coat polysaccharide biosynthesis protein SpsF|tara:strand:+ start:2158 stop:2922 length:765 start_codon:yes stop_codon:yes gene_type:complete
MNSLWIIIQARMLSSRLPGKVVKDIEGSPMIAHVIRRVKRSKFGANVCLATTGESADDILERIAAQEEVACFRGSRDDVLSRYYEAAKQNHAEMIVRITGDCPVIDPQVIDRVVEHHIETKAEYTSNIHPPTFPDGLDVEVFSFDVLERARAQANKIYQREHVTAYMWENTDMFSNQNIVHTEDLNKLRWIVDEEEDLQFMRNLFHQLYAAEKKDFVMSDILEVFRRDQQLREINQGIQRNEGFTKSLKEDGLL